VADKRNIGLIEESYNVPKYDITSDITELPLSQFDYALCTEVLEHVPDPALGFLSVMNSLKTGGLALFSFPLNSKIHQAPYYFCSGLSPYFIIHHSELRDFKVLDLFILGDSCDNLIELVPQLFGQLSFKRFHLAHYTRKMLKMILPKLRTKYGQDWLSSGGLAVFAIIKK